ncbi:hypothetical protein KEM52_000297, partial [Ascosphaera acerosa]
MGRRRREGEQAGGRPKRRKTHDDDGDESAPRHQNPAHATQPIKITSHKQLRELLDPQQGAAEVKQGASASASASAAAAWILVCLRAFKDFLASLSDTTDSTDDARRAASLRILKLYCDSQYTSSTATATGAAEPDHAPEPAPCFLDLCTAWAYGESAADDSLRSLAPSVLAALLKTAGARPELHGPARALCRHLLQREQLRLLARALAAPRGKPHLVSPCLRLLTEVVAFDGGACAALVWARREITLKRLEVFLVAGKAAAPAAPAPAAPGKAAAPPTLRRIAQRYVLAHLRCLPPQAKEEFLAHGKVMRAFLEEIRRDAADMVLEIVRALDRCVVGDAGLARAAKARLLNRWNLERLVTLYGYGRDTADGEDDDTTGGG